MTKPFLLNINVEEGEKYTFGNITFIGNTVYSNRAIKQSCYVLKKEILIMVSAYKNALQIILNQMPKILPTSIKIMAICFQQSILLKLVQITM